MTRSIWAGLRILGGAGIIAALLWRLGTGAFLAGIRAIDARVVAIAFGIGVLTTVFSAWRWCLVARGLGLRLSLPTAIADYYQALVVNAALPGGVLGDVDRAVRHGRDEGDVGRGVRAVVLERTAGQLVLFGGGLVVLVAVPSPMRTQLHQHSTALAIVAVSVLLAGGLAVVFGRRLRRSESRVAGAVRTGLTEVRVGLLAHRSWPGIALASVVVLLGHLATFVVAARAAGSTTSIIQLAPLLVLALAAMTLPINIGGWGPREAVTAWAFGAAGLSAAQGLTTAVVYGVFAFVAALPGAAVVLVRAIARLRARKAASVRPSSPTETTPSHRTGPVSASGSRQLAGSVR